MTTQDRYTLNARNMSVYYGSFKAINSVNLDIERNKITALIGPSGCGKSTVLRSFNRMNDLVPGAVAGLRCDAYHAVIPSTQAGMIQYQPSQVQKRGLGIRDWGLGKTTSSQLIPESLL